MSIAKCLCGCDGNVPSMLRMRLPKGRLQNSNVTLKPSRFAEAPAKSLEKFKIGGQRLTLVAYVLSRCTYDVLRCLVKCTVTNTKLFEVL